MNNKSIMAASGVTVTALSRSYVENLMKNDGNDSDLYHRNSSSSGSSSVGSRQVLSDLVRVYVSDNADFIFNK